MRPDLEHYYLIDQYLDHTLKGEALAAFENELLHNSAFAGQVQEQRMLNDLILEAELQSVRSQMAKDLSAIQKPSFFRMHWQWIGGGILCVLGVLFFMIPDQTDTSGTAPQSTAAAENTSGSVVEAAEYIHAQPSEKQRRRAVSAVQEDNNTAVKIADTAALIIRVEPVRAPADVLQNITSGSATETAQTEAITKTDCAATKITFAVSTETSCTDSETGALHVSEITGGNAPYTLNVNNKKVSKHTITALRGGIYEISVSDRNGCSSIQKATVAEKNCKPLVQQGAAFNINPAIGETCRIPVYTDKKGTVTIYNRGGKIIYRETNPSGDAVEWNGTDGYGALAEAGLYVYIIAYTDGTNVSGEVTITR